MSQEPTEPNTVQPGETSPTLVDFTPETLAPEQIQALKAEGAKAAELFERLLRTTADFDNFKKRAARERDETRKAAAEGVIVRLLPILDSFEKAMAAANQPNTNIDVLKAGVLMIHGQLRAAFSELGLEEISVLGQPFDPALHEAVSQLETTSAPEGQVVQELRKGFRLRERLLRPASVVVAKSPASSACPSGSTQD
ncbi:MAG: nucleotide exchange factor GrpE [Pedosphaera sp.]|nr:nucleotide exchange factor GrpE [Pedosphaera sp.]